VRRHEQSERVAATPPQINPAPAGRLRIRASFGKICMLL
jgi:hypothetical protein